MAEKSEKRDDDAGLERELINAFYDILREEEEVHKIYGKKYTKIFSGLRAAYEKMFEAQLERR